MKFDYFDLFEVHGLDDESFNACTYDEEDGCYNGYEDDYYDYNNDDDDYYRYYW